MNQDNKENSSSLGCSTYYEGFKYHRKYVGKKFASFWCCNNRSTNSACSAKLKKNFSGTIFDVTGKHSDSCYAKAEESRVALGIVDLNVDNENVKKSKNLTHFMLKRAEEIALENLAMRPKQVFLKVLEEAKVDNYSFNGATNLQIINRVKNCRAKINGNDVFRTIEMDNVAKSTKTNQFFLQFNVTFPSSYSGKLERVLGYGNPTLFRCFGGNQKVFIDGTFRIVPKPFYQCLIVMVFDNQTDAYVPVFYILLTSKKEKVYDKALQQMNDAVGDKINPSSVTCDYERGLHNSISRAFPKAIINGCLFHWKQAIRRKLADLKCDRWTIDRFTPADSIETLTLIPPNEIESKGIPFVRSAIETDDLPQEEHERLEQFWKYFKRYWMSSPTFINSWNTNHHSKEKADDIKRTNNGLERYNKTLKAIFADETPSLLTFITTIEKESFAQVAKLDCIRNGLVDQSKKRRNNVCHDDNNRNKISKFYHEFNPNIN